MGSLIDDMVKETMEQAIKAAHAIDYMDENDYLIGGYTDELKIIKEYARTLNELRFKIEKLGYKVETEELPFFDPR